MLYIVSRSRSSTDRHVEAKDFAAKKDHIYLDAMGFGMGSSCLQLTFQACNINDAKRLYDAFIPIGPILVRSSKHSISFSSDFLSSWH